MISTCTFP